MTVQELGRTRLHEAQVGSRVIDQQVLSVSELGYVFTRADRHERRRNQGFIVEGRRWLHAQVALSRWIVKKLRHRADEANAWLAYSRPTIQYQRDASIRAYEIAVFADYALIPGRKGDVLVVRENIDKNWQPL